MAPYAFDLLDEEQKKKAEDQAAQGSAPAMTGGGETFGGGGSGAAQDGQEKGTTKQGSGFVGLDKYMGANRGSGFGDQVAGKVRSSVEGAKQDLGTNAQGFTQASNQSAIKWGDVQNDTKGIINNAGDSTTQDDAAKIQKYSNAHYQGPDTFADSAFGAKAQGGVQKATQQAKALQSEGGRFALLDQFYGRPKYSMGEKSLDNLLVQNQPGVAARAQSIGGQAKQLESEAGTTEQGLNNLAAMNRSGTEETTKNTRGLLDTARSDFESDLHNRYDQNQQTNTAYAQARRADLSDDALDADTMGLTGLADGSNLYDLNLSNYLRDVPQASVGQFASDQDYAKYLALSQLAGEDPTLLSPGDRTQAGSAKGPLEVDKDRLQHDLSARGSEYQQVLSQGTSERQAQIAQANAAFQTALQQFGPSAGQTQSAYGNLQRMQKDLADWTTAVNTQYGANRKVSKAGG